MLVVRCAACDTMSQPGDVLCRNCGTALTTDHVASTGSPDRGDRVLSCEACGTLSQAGDVLCRKCGKALKQQTQPAERETVSSRNQNAESQNQDETYAKLDAVEATLRASAAESVTTQTPEPSPELVARPPRRTFLKRPWTSDWVFWVAVGATFILIPNVYQAGKDVWGESAAFLLLAGTFTIFLTIVTAVIIGLQVLLIRFLFRRAFQFLFRRASKKKKLSRNPLDSVQGWKSDPLDERRQRWWNGERWTAAVNPEEPAFRDRAVPASIAAIIILPLAVAFFIGSNVDSRTPEMILQEIKSNPDQALEILDGLSDETSLEVLELMLWEEMLETGEAPEFDGLFTQ